MSTYARIENDLITEYPISEGIIRAENPSTLFAANDFQPPENYVLVVDSEKPVQTVTNVITEGTPILIEGVWMQQWIESEADEAVLFERHEALKQSTNLGLYAQYQQDINAPITVNDVQYQTDANALLQIILQAVSNPKDVTIKSVVNAISTRNQTALDDLNANLIK